MNNATEGLYRRQIAMWSTTEHLDMLQKTPYKIQRIWPGSFWQNFYKKMTRKWFGGWSSNTLFREEGSLDQGSPSRKEGTQAIVRTNVLYQQMRGTKTWGILTLFLGQVTGNRKIKDWAIVRAHV